MSYSYLEFLFLVYDWVLLSDDTGNKHMHFSATTYEQQQLDDWYNIFISWRLYKIQVSHHLQR